MAFEQALGLEQAISLGDGHGIDGVLDRKPADRRQLGALTQLATGDKATDLLYQLSVERDTGARMEDEHGAMP